MSFFVRKMERRNGRDQNRTDEKLKNPAVQEKNTIVKERQRRKIMITVEWEEANKLELGELMEMAKDGYCFCVSDGRIKSVGVAVSLPS